MNWRNVWSASGTRRSIKYYFLLKTKKKGKVAQVLHIYTRHHAVIKLFRQTICIRFLTIIVFF